jgi:LysM repeat protein
MLHPSRSGLILIVTTLLLFVGVFAAMAQGQSYTVQQGDTLDGIAAFYDVQTQCLATSNNIAKPAELKIGQVINIDTSCPRYDGLDFVTNPRAEDGNTGSNQGGGGGSGDEAGVQAGPNDETYTVQVSDTLDTIGQEFDVSVVSLQLVNEIGPRDAIFPGDTLVIPGDAPAYGQFPAISNPSAPLGSQELGQGGGGVTAGPNDQTYVVQPNDSLDRIGALFDTQVACMAETNNITDASTVFPGQTVVVPASCPVYDGYDFVINPRGSNGEITGGDTDSTASDANG